MRCVCDDIGGARRLLCREVAKLGGAVLCGRYGGGGSDMLLLSTNGSGAARLRLFAEFMEMTSEVSMPVK